MSKEFSLLMPLEESFTQWLLYSEGPGHHVHMCSCMGCLHIFISIPVKLSCFVQYTCYLFPYCHDMLTNG